MDELKAPPAIALANGTHLPPGELVASFRDRAEVNRAIEYLASQKFPVHTLFVVGRDLRQVDYITGQATYPRAALGGFIQGLGLGSLVALFNSMITNTSLLANFLSILPLALGLCMIYSIVLASRAKGKGIRSRTQMLPAHFDLMAIPATAAAARHLLNLTQRPADLGPHRAGSQMGPAGPAEGSGPTPQPGTGPAHPANPANLAPGSETQRPEPFLPGFGPAQQAQVAPQPPTQPVFTPPAPTNRDGSPAAGRYGLRVESQEEFEATIRKGPASSEPEGEEKAPEA
ncbi:MAG: general stress protein [Rothia sp. (in: high G+C Gram-positive bacteria)]|nr:general stress protein [Rothia sp. (in: high G+C Gram-positive bacteria)]